MRNLTPGYVTMIIGIKMKVGIMSNSVHGEKGYVTSEALVSYTSSYLFLRNTTRKPLRHKDTEWYDDESST